MKIIEFVYRISSAWVLIWIVLINLFIIVKLIKKTGDTLALKVYTVDYTKKNSNMIYQTPTTNNTKQFTANSTTTASYYATTTIGTAKHHHHHQNGGDYFDGTKSLPHKKKRKYFQLDCCCFY